MHGLSAHINIKPRSCKPYTPVMHLVDLLVALLLPKVAVPATHRTTLSYISCAAESIALTLIRFAYMQQAY